VALARNALIWASKNEWIETQFRSRAFARKAVSRFMPGEDVEDALREAVRLRDDHGIPTVVTALGENLARLADAAGVRDHYLDVMDRIRDRELDTHVSVKLTQLGLDLDPQAALEHCRRLAEAAAGHDSFFWIDIEESHYVDVTLDLYETLRGEFPAVGLCLQAYLFRTADDLERLLSIGGTIRLVKGAYREAADVAFPRKKDTDGNFLALARRMLEHAAGRPTPRHGMATHDLALLERIREEAPALGLPGDAYEIQMLYGIRTEEQIRMASAGQRVRVLISYGESWFPWYVRRLAERPANLGFVLRSMVGG
jgi:proline dehydrogenase